MNIDDLTDLIAGGEDSFTQFKENLQDARRLAEELVAFSNAEGGQLIIGVSDDHQIKGLSPEDLHRLHQLISNTANENVKPRFIHLSSSSRSRRNCCCWCRFVKVMHDLMLPVQEFISPNLVRISGASLLKNCVGSLQRVEVYLLKRVY